MRARISLTLQEQIAPRKCNVEGRVTTCSRHEAHGIECAEEQRLLAQAESQVSHNEPACEYRHVKEATRHDGRGGGGQTPAGGATHCICGAMAPRTIQLVNGWADSNEYIVSADGPPMVAAVDDDPRDAHRSARTRPRQGKKRGRDWACYGMAYIVLLEYVCISWLTPRTPRPRGRTCSGTGPRACRSRASQNPATASSRRPHGLGQQM